MKKTLPRVMIFGFSLIELLIVISIISVLSAIALLMFTNIQKNSRDAKRQSDLRVIQSALEQYHADQNFYPAGGIASGSALTNATGVTPTPAVIKTYLQAIPSDPILSNNSYCYIATPESPACTNVGDNTCTSYKLYAALENPATSSAYTCATKTYNLEIVAP